MDAFTRLEAIGIPYDPVSVDTDQIIPARFLKYSRAGGYDKYLFHDARFDEQGKERPDFILNREPYRHGRIFVGNANFGSGSSREGAVYALYDYGIRSVIAPSFGDIFFNNCMKNGMVPARLPAAACDDLRAQLTRAPGAKVVVDLVARQVSAPDGTSWPFEIDDFRRDMLLNGVDELGLTLQNLGEIERFETAYRAEVPWLSR